MKQRYSLYIKEKESWVWIINFDSYLDAKAMESEYKDQGIEVEISDNLDVMPDA